MKSKRLYFKIFAAAFLLFLFFYYWAAIERLIASVLGAMASFIIGFAIAYVVNILASFIERHYFKKSEKKFVIKTRRPFSITVAYLAVTALIALIVVLIIPQLTECIKMILATVPELFEKATDWLAEKGILTGELLESFEGMDWKSNLDKIIDTVFSGIGNVASLAIGIIFTVGGVIITAFVSIVFSIYFLSGKDTLIRQIKKLAARFIPPKKAKTIGHVIGALDVSFHKYIVGQTTEALILGVLCFVGMLIFRIPYAPMISSLIAFLALIPIAGAFIGGGVGAIMILTVSPVKALIFIIFLVILQQFEGNVIYPKVVGSSMGLPGIWVLLAITVGGGIAGILGMLLSVPITAAVYTLLKKKVNEKKPKKVIARRVKVRRETQK